MLFHSRTVISAALCGLAALTGCTEDASGGSCDFTGGSSAAFGEASIDALIDATTQFNIAATDIDARVHQACNNIAQDLGAETAADTKTACDNAVAAINEVKSANVSATLVVEFAPAVCTADLSAAVQCAARCDAEVSVDAEPVRCDGGQLSGSCSATCMGSCTLQGSASCEGTCGGTCSGTCSGRVSGTCDGTCQGQCEGTCETTASDGSCSGTCTGTCRGTCTGTVEGTCSGECSGSCEGSCRADVSGQCEGTCSGQCSVEFEEPMCEGGEVVVDAEASCSAACEAEASANVECTEPELVVTFEGAADTEDFEALAATLRDNLGVFLEVSGRLDSMVAASVNFATSLSGAVTAAATSSVQAAQCVARAAEVQAAAAAKVNVSVEASVNVSAAASAGTS